MGVTVTFIAILELLREGLIEIVQSEPFAPIHVRAGAPRPRQPRRRQRAGRQRPAGQRTMTEHPLASVVEAVLLAAGRPVTRRADARAVRRTAASARRGSQRSRCDALQRSYAGRGVELREVASGWRVQVRPQHADVVSRLWQERPSRYSRALLETLALIAYRQPITRGEIEDIRGVTVSTTIMRTLHERNWIRVVGHREVPGRPELLGTTREFLDYFGLKSLDDLPTLAELQDLEDIKEQLDLPEAPIGAALAGRTTSRRRSRGRAGASRRRRPWIATDDAESDDPGDGAARRPTDDAPRHPGDPSDADLERTPA